MIDINSLERQLKALLADRWAGAPVKHGLPRVPQRGALPAATADYEARLVYLPRAGATPGHLYCCLQDGAGAWSWRQLD